MLRDQAHSRAWGASSSARAFTAAPSELRYGARARSCWALLRNRKTVLGCFAGVPRVTIAKGKANLFIDGNPIVFAGAIKSMTGAPKTGDPVIVCDWKDSAVAWGVYNSVSMFRVRIMQLDREVRADPAAALDVEHVLEKRIRMAVQLRRDLGFPSSATNVYRLINSEGDRLSGLIVDVLGDAMVAMASAAWVQLHKEAVVRALQGATGIQAITWRSDAYMMKLEGLEDAAAASAAAGDEDADAAAQPGERVVVVEEGVKYYADPKGQKTGFYADQRDSRAFLRSCVSGKRVLDLCCYTGGFALNAALHGASEVVGVDSSVAAIEMARQNAQLNDVADRCSFVVKQIEAFMEEAAASDTQWDVIVLDPPKLAPSAKMLDRATYKYTLLNTAAMKLLKPDGLLMTCSCSGAMTQSGTFPDVISAAARKLRRPVTVVRQAGAGSDHVTSDQYREGCYLTNLLVRVGDASGLGCAQSEANP